MIRRRVIAASLSAVVLMLAALWPAAAHAAPVVPATGSPATLSTAATGGFVGVTPFRLLDTREGNGAPKAPVGPGGSIDLQVTGRGGVPAADVAAVVLNVTAIGPSESGFVTAWPAGEPRPTASNLNFVAGQTVPNLVIVKVGTSGMVSLFNLAGTVNLAADISGYYTTASQLVAVTPTRLLDTRSGLGGVQGPTSGSVTVQAAGQAGIPLGATSVVLNVTVDQPTSAGFLTVWPTGSAQPDASNLNFVAGQTVPNLVIAKVGSDGKISYFNNSGRVQVIMDVLGYTAGGAAGTDAEFTPQVPTRVLDTRSGVGGPAGRVVGGGTIHLALLGRGGVPGTGVGAVVMNLTVTDPETSGYLTAYPDDAALPTASNVNFVAGQTVPNLVVVPVGAAGGVDIYNFGGAAHVVADVLGWYASPTAWLRSAPVPSLCNSQAGNLVDGELPPSLLAHDPDALIPPSVELLDTPPPAQGQLNARAVTVATVLCVYPSWSYPEGYQSLVVWDDQHQLVGAVTVDGYPVQVTPDGDGFLVIWNSCTPDILVCIPDKTHIGRLVQTNGGLQLQESVTSACPGFVFNDHEDYADQIVVAGIDCPAATAVITHIGAQHDPWGDPPIVTIDGFTCRFTELPGAPDDAGRSGRYDCSRPGAVLTFEFDAGE